MLIDANLLVFAVNKESPFHGKSYDWLNDRLNGDQQIGIPWLSLGAFIRLITNPRIVKGPLAPTEAWRQIEDWLANDLVWTPAPTPHHAKILGDLIKHHRPTGNLITDAQIAALAIEHGLEVCSADTDFARFTEIRWHNPLADS
jgi:toxin-antitoxin system PIN domain toxin